MSPFLMSWLIWRASSPTVARRSASRTRAVLVRRRAARSPSSRDNLPTSSVPESKSTSRRSRSSTAVFSARAVERPADSRRHPHRQQQGGDAGPRGGQEEPGVRAAQKRSERRQRLRDLRAVPARPPSGAPSPARITGTCSSPTAESSAASGPGLDASTTLRQGSAATRRSPDRGPAAREMPRPPRRHRRG